MNDTEKIPFDGKLTSEALQEMRAEAEKLLHKSEENKRLAAPPEKKVV